MMPACVEILVGRPMGGAANDVVLVNEYGKRAILGDIRRVLERAGVGAVELNYCTLADYKEVIGAIERRNAGRDFVVLQLCDGTEVDGYPGLSVVKMLQKHHIRFTGADAAFFEITTSKVQMKERLIAGGVSTSPFIILKNDESINRAATTLCFPMIIKPDVSYSSIGITSAGILKDARDAQLAVANINQYVQASCGEAAVPEYFIERFLEGREFTVLITGGTRTAMPFADARASVGAMRQLPPGPPHAPRGSGGRRESADGCKVYPPVERAFNRSLNKYEKILSFDEYWRGYGINGAPCGAFGDASDEHCGNARQEPRESVGSASSELYRYELVCDKQLSESLTRLALDAYTCLGGTGYGRVDIRADAGGALYVLEVNAQPSFSLCDTETSMGNILKLARADPVEFMREILV